MDNKSARMSLERQYGKGCMFKKAGVEKQVEQLRVIKTYKTFIQEKRYTRKKVRKLERNMTYHHLVHKSDGGKCTEENGAVINELAHRYIHSLPREQEEVINDMLRDYKLNISGGFISVTNDLDINNTFNIQLDLDNDNYLEIPVYDNTSKDTLKYNRAKNKRELNKLIQEGISKYEEER